MKKQISLTEKCTKKLRKEILAGKWNKADEYINEQELCEYLSVSRVTVRRCLYKLCNENLLRSIPYKGYVLGPSAFVKQRTVKKKGSSVRNEILIVESPDNVLANTEQAIWDAAVNEAELHNLHIDFCRMRRTQLIEELRTNLAADLFGIALGWDERYVAEQLVGEGIPTVTVERHHRGLPIDSVVQDDQQGTEQAIEHLWNLGHRRISLIVLDSKEGHPMERREAFIGCLLRRGIFEPESIEVARGIDSRGGRIAMQKILDRNIRPTAIILCHIEMAAGAFEECLSRGIEIGKHLSVVCWGTPETQKIHLANTQWEKTSLDLISWSREEMGRVAIRMIHARNAEPYLPHMRITIPTYLTKQGSSVSLQKQKSI